MCLAAWHTQGYAGSHLIPFSSRRRHEFSLGCMRVYNGGDGGELTRMWTGSPCDVTTQESLHGGRRGSAGGPGAERVRRDLTPEVASPTSGASVRGHQEGVLHVTLQRPRETKSWVNIAKCWITEKMAILRLCPSPSAFLPWAHCWTLGRAGRPGSVKLGARGSGQWASPTFYLFLGRTQ